LAAVASILFAVEEMVSLPIPFLKLGLANVVTLWVLIGYGVPEAVAVVTLRVLVGNLLIGTLFQPNFIFSLSGGLASALVMGGVLKYGARWFGLIGISILGAFTKNSMQLLVAYVLWVHQSRLLSLLPMFFLLSIIAGTLVGLLTASLMKKIHFPGMRGGTAFSAFF
jgi:heptaprenyl diphosphate synthase